jgi:uncharacterized protein with PQ loop repeat
MPISSRGLYHLNKRRRASNKKKINKHLEPYPHPNKFIQAIDYSAMTIGIIIPLMTIPQIIQIFATQDASSISIPTWGAYIFSSVFWFAYAVIHKARPLMVNCMIWLIVNTTVVIGALIY